MSKLLIAILLIVTYLPHTIVAQDPESQDDLAPYLYYYSDYLNAFVVERADGTDARIVGEVSEPRPRYTRPEWYTTSFSVNEIGWSASGEWLAWLAYGQHRYHLEVVHVSGKRRLTVVDWLESNLALWSPTQDYLAVWGQSLGSKWGLKFCDRTLWIVDATRDTFVNAIDYDSPGLLPKMADLCAGQFQEMFWSPDEQSLVLVYKTLDYSNTIRTVTNTYITLTPNTPAHYITLPELECGNISAEGWFIQAQETGIVAQNAFSDVQIGFPEIAPENLCAYTRHEPNPTRLNLQIHPLPPEEISPGSPFFQTEWSPDKTWMLVSNDAGIYMVDGDNLTPLILYTSDLYWSDPIWHWLTNEKVVIVHYGTTVDDYQERAFVTVYDHSKQEITSEQEIPLASLGAKSHLYDLWYTNIQMTSDERYLLWIRAAPIVYEMQTQSFRLYRPDADGLMSTMGGNINLHPDGEWAIVTDEGLVSSGGGGKNHMGVIRVGSDYQRDLPTPMFGSAKWLPDPVQTELLPPPTKTPLTPQPVQILKTGHWTADLVWNETGTTLAYRQHFHDENFNHFDEDTPASFTGDLLTNEQTLLPLESQFHEKLTWEGDEVQIAPPLNFRDWTGYPALDVNPMGYLAILDSGRVYNIAGQAVAELGLYFNTSASFSPDGRYLAIGGTYDESRVTIFDTDTWEIVGRLPHNATSLAFSPDGKYLAVSASWEILIYELDAILGQPQ